MAWSGGLIDWIEDDTANISVVFSWQIQKAYQRAVWLNQEGYKVIVGGPAIASHKRYFKGVAETGEDAGDVLYRHNKDATFTSRGCDRDCPFCIVKMAYGGLVENKDWEVRPIICDDNILGTSRAHFDDVVDRLMPVKNVDFNQGLDARLLTKHHAEQIRKLNTKVVRMAWDSIEMENKFLSAWQKLRDAGIPKSHIQAYVLIGYDDTPADALHRLQTIKDLGGLPNPMRYQPIDAKQRNDYIHPNWTEKELKAFMRYWSKQKWLRPIPFADYLDRYETQGHPEKGYSINNGQQDEQQLRMEL